jgi:hypothetical protein
MKLEILVLSLGSWKASKEQTDHSHSPSFSLYTIIISLGGRKRERGKILINSITKGNRSCN